uniref:hypothetical protein n=1 Tax=Acinetobacter baumannii TaxID=470 RepID=UPI00117861BC
MLDHHVPDGTNEANGFAPTAAQKGVWIDQSIDPSSTNYNIGEYLEICGEIDLTVFRSAMDRV